MVLFQAQQHQRCAGPSTFKGKHSGFIDISKCVVGWVFFLLFFLSENEPFPFVLYTYSIESFAEVQKDYINWLPLVN